jgi:hypothetical protein
MGGATSFPAPYHHARLVGISGFVFLLRVKAIRKRLWVLRSGSVSMLWCDFGVSLPAGCVFALSYYLWVVVVGV